MKKTITILLGILILMPFKLTAQRKSISGQAWIDRDVENDNTFAGIDSSCIKFDRVGNCWFISVFDSIGNNVFKVEIDGDINLLDDKGIGLLSGARISFDDQSTDEIEITNANVGIGTTSPAVKLHTLHSSAGEGNILEVEHDDNTNSASYSRVLIKTGGSSGGDSYINFEVNGGGEYHVGIDNSDSDKLKIGTGQTPGSNTIMTINSTDVDIDAIVTVDALVLDTIKITQKAPTDNSILKYDAATDSLEWEPDTGGASEIQILLRPETAKLPASNPGVIDAGENNNKILFDADTDESVSWGGVLDDDYGSGTLYADVYWSMASATANEVIFGLQFWAYSPSDAADINTESYDTVNLTSATTVPGTAGYMVKTSITLTNDDGIAAGDHYRIKFYRDADNAGDDATGDLEIYEIVIRE